MAPSKRPKVELDRFDLAILAILQTDNTTPQRQIGEAVNLSAPAVQRRIKRMEETGVIRANVALIDPVSVNQALTILVEVEVESEQIASARCGEGGLHRSTRGAAMLLCYRRRRFHARRHRPDHGRIRSLHAAHVLRQSEHQALPHFRDHGSGEGQSIGTD